MCFLSTRLLRKKVPIILLTELMNRTSGNKGSRYQHPMSRCNLILIVKDSLLISPCLSLAFNIYLISLSNYFILTSCKTDGNTPPSDSLPHPVTVAFSPTSKSSVAGRQIGAMCGANCTVDSNFTRARSYS